MRAVIFVAVAFVLAATMTAGQSGSGTSGGGSASSGGGSTPSGGLGTRPPGSGSGSGSLEAKVDRHVMCFVDPQKTVFRIESFPPAKTKVIMTNADGTVKTVEYDPLVKPSNADNVPSGVVDNWPQGVAFGNSMLQQGVFPVLGLPGNQFTKAMWSSDLNGRVDNLVFTGELIAATFSSILCPDWANCQFFTGIVGLHCWEDVETCCGNNTANPQCIAKTVTDHQCCAAHVSSTVCTSQQSCCTSTGSDILSSSAACCDAGSTCCAGANIALCCAKGETCDAANNQCVAAGETPAPGISLPPGFTLPPFTLPSIPPGTLPPMTLPTMPPVTMPTMPPVPTPASHGSGSGSQGNQSTGNVSSEVTYVQHLHRELRHPQVHVAADGWIYFCPTPITDGSSSAALDANCTAIRPVKFYETDVNGDSTWVEAANPPMQREIDDLYKGILVGAPANATIPLCSSNNNGSSGSSISGGSASMVCGATSNGGLLWYWVLPLTIELDSIAEGFLSIDAMTFGDHGWFMFDGTNYTVHPGMSKFDVSITGYAFANNGTAVYFDIEPKNEAQFLLSANETAAAGAVANSRIIGAPRYAISNGSLALSAVWKSANVSVSKETGAARFTFEGPFRNMAYDPFVE